MEEVSLEKLQQTKSLFLGCYFLICSVERPSAGLLTCAFHV